MPSTPSYLQVSRINSHIERLCGNFGKYVKIFEEDPFEYNMLRAHCRAMELIEGQSGIMDSTSSDDCLDALYDVLVAFGMNKKAAKLLPRDQFVHQIRANTETLISFESKTLTNVSESVIARLWNSIETLSLSKTGSQLVTGSKALHHLLPDLVPLVDRRYTRPFFAYMPQPFQDNQGPAFKFMLPYFAKIAQNVDLSHYVGRSAWMTSETKVIDNAIVGFGKDHRRIIKETGFAPQCCTKGLWS